MDSSFKYSIGSAGHAAGIVNPCGFFIGINWKQEGLPEQMPE
jgi:hypothetical protein